MSTHGNDCHGYSSSSCDHKEHERVDDDQSNLVLLGNNLVVLGSSLVLLGSSLVLLGSSLVLLGSSLVL
jgi:hypothetical protein